MEDFLTKGKDVKHLQLPHNWQTKAASCYLLEPGGSKMNFPFRFPVFFLFFFFSSHMHPQGIQTKQL